jgi:hypothetical protein
VAVELGDDRVDGTTRVQRSAPQVARAWVKGSLFASRQVTNDHLTVGHTAAQVRQLIAGGIEV